MKKLLRYLKIYLHRKDKEMDIKAQKEQNSKIVKAILLNKTPKQVIQQLTDITELVNKKLDNILEISTDAVNVITEYKKT